MVYGIGTDIISILRIKEALEREPDRFAQKILGVDELIKYRGYQQTNVERSICYVASRFAAKEAFSKALGLGMRDPLSWGGIQVVNNAVGKPDFVFSDALAQWMVERNLSAQISISDEEKYAVAFVIILQAAANHSM